MQLETPEKRKINLISPFITPPQKIVVLQVTVQSFPVIDTYKVLEITSFSGISPLHVSFTSSTWGSYAVPYIRLRKVKDNPELSRSYIWVHAFSKPSTLPSADSAASFKQNLQNQSWLAHTWLFFCSNAGQLALRFCEALLKLIGWEKCVRTSRQMLRSNR